MNQQSYVHIRLRRDTAQNWTNNNPVLKIGEPGLETDTRKLKFGDGTTAWNNLPYSGVDVNDNLLLENIDDRVANLIKAGSNISINYNDNSNELIISATGLQLSGDYATLVNGKIPAVQLPSYVDDVLEFNNLSSFPSSGEGDKIYVAKDSNKTYRWSGSAYVEISASPGSTDAVPEGSVNLYYTNARASAAAPVQSVAGRTGAVTLAKADVGLGNVDNTSDANKPISTATQAALDGKQAAGNYAASSHTHIAGQFVFFDNDRILGRTSASSSTGQEIVCTAFGRSLIDDSDAADGRSTLGLGNVDNTSDANKPVSTAQAAADAAVQAHAIQRANHTGTQAISTVSGLQTALDGKAATSHTHGNITNDGAIGSAANLPVITTTSGVLTTGTFGTGANTFCQGNDSRLSDARTPTAHKSTHATGGSDALTPNDIGAMHVAGTGTNSINARLGSCLAVGTASVVSGGNQNVANGNYSVVAGGDGNVASNNSSVVSGGLGNSAANSFSVIGGGVENSAIADYATVAGGQKNAARGGHSYIAGGLNNLAFSVGSAAAGINNVAAQKVRRASNIGSTQGNITVLNALAADFDNVGMQALEIRYFSASLGWQRTTRTVSTATQSGSNVNLVLTETVGGTEQWTDVTVVNTFESDASAGQIVYGTNNTACGLFDVVAGGIGNSATGGYGFVGSGNGNVASASQAVVVGGSNNSSTNIYAAIVGGLNNTAGSRAFVGGGATNVASGQYSAIVCGQENVASALHANVLGGLGNTAAGEYSAMIGGARGKARLFGEISHAAGRFVNSGDAQHCMFVSRRQTTDATANQSLFLNGTNQRLTLPAQTALTFVIKLAAYNVTNNAAAWWVFRGGIKRDNANATALIGTVSVETGADTSMASAAASVVADDSNDALDIRVTGIAGETIRWVASVDVAQVSAGVV